ncbi:hypothetical protein HDU98_012029 [Podochytrium sp. JEL0797]|nr:hypothetical protein HDU98_012029 [Podochytrium sp. JEL0797]
MLTNTARNSFRSLSRRTNQHPSTRRSLWGLTTHRRNAAILQPRSAFANDPFLLEPFSLMERRMNSLFNELASPSKLDEPFCSTMVNGPRMNIKELDKSYVFNVEVPGIPKDEINVSVKDGVLTISGEHKNEVVDKDEVRHVIERASGSFSRSIGLPKDVDADSIKASMSDGVLKLELGKKEKVDEDEGIKKIAIE